MARGDCFALCEDILMWAYTGWSRFFLKRTAKLIDSIKKGITFLTNNIFFCYPA
jgi:hypothetical protein